MRFRPRPQKDEVQVRFYVDRNKYHEFVKKVKSEGLVIKDVFNQFIDWFLREKQ